VLAANSRAQFLATTASIFFSLASSDAFAAPAANTDPVHDIEDRMDHYFSAPRSPETFRALSGMGLPAGAKADSDGEISRWWSASVDEKELLQRLFPKLDMSQPYWYPDFGACRPEAPLQQFRARLNQLGSEHHPYVVQWLRVERAVLSTCEPGRSKTAVVALPPPLEVTDPATALLQHQDRAYQQAALLFYQNDGAGALAAFQAIANDRASPNRPLAAYMVLAIQAGSGAGAIAPQRSTANSVVLPPEQSLKAIQAVLADQSLQSIHAMAAALIGWVGANVADSPARTAQVREAISALMASTERLEHDAQLLKRYEAALTDIDFLHGKFLTDPDWVLTGNVPASYQASAALAELAKRVPMAAWVAFPTNAYRERAWVLAAVAPESAAVHAYLDRMGGKISGNGADAENPWLHENPETSARTLSALVDDELTRLKMNIADEQAAAGLGLDYYNLIRHLLMDRDDRSANFKIALQRLEDFPYKATLAYGHAIDDSLKYLITEGRLAEARQMRDALKLDRPEGAMSNTSSKGALLVLAEDEDHLMHVLASGFHYPREYVNHLSVAELWRLAGRGELSRDDRALLVRAAWSRDYAMGHTISVQHDHLLRALAPEITATWQAPAGHEVKPDDIAVVRDVLKSPGLNTVVEDFSRMPDDESSEATATLTGLDHYNHNDNNWWCAWDLVNHDAALDRTLANSFGLYDDRPEAMQARVRTRLSIALQGSFLFRNINPNELEDLSKVKSAPQFLSKQVIAWVRNGDVFASRGGEAEALADAVLSTRWGCNRHGSHKGSHTAYSREAFTLLHARFADTPEAKRTTYWFN
jgi:hypothetical protein